MTDFTNLQALLATNFQVPFQTQGEEQGSATLTLQPDEQRILGPAGAQLVYTFENGRFVSVEILLAAG